MIQLSLPATCEQNFPIGVPRLRVEDERLVRGRGRFVDDVDTDECLYLEFVRSQSSSARLIKLDVETARASEGVVAVITGVDVAVLGELSINPLIDGMQAPKSGLLARDHIHAVGQPLAAVIAKTRMQAIDAAQLVSWEYEIDEDRASKNAFRQAWRTGDCEGQSCPHLACKSGALPACTDGLGAACDGGGSGRDRVFDRMDLDPDSAQGQG